MINCNYYNQIAPYYLNDLLILDYSVNLIK